MQLMHSPNAHVPMKRTTQLLMKIINSNCTSMAPTSDKHTDGQQGLQPGTGNDFQRSACPSVLKQLFAPTFGLLLAQTRTAYPVQGDYCQTIDSPPCKHTLCNGLEQGFLPAAGGRTQEAPEA